MGKVYYLNSFILKRYYDSLEKQAKAEPNKNDPKSKLQEKRNESK